MFGERVRVEFHVLSVGSAPIPSLKVMLNLEILRFGHRDWYCGETRRNNEQDQSNGDTSSKQPSVSFVDDYFRTPFLGRVAWGCSAKLVIIHLLGFYAVVYLNQVSWTTLAFRE